MEESAVEEETMSPKMVLEDSPPVMAPASSTFTDAANGIDTAEPDSRHDTEEPSIPGVDGIETTDVVLPTDAVASSFIEHAPDDDDGDDNNASETNITAVTHDPVPLDISDLNKDLSTLEQTIESESLNNAVPTFGGGQDADAKEEQDLDGAAAPLVPNAKPDKAGVDTKEECNLVSNVVVDLVDLADHTLGATLDHPEDSVAVVPNDNTTIHTSIAKDDISTKTDVIVLAKEPEECTPTHGLAEDESVAFLDDASKAVGGSFEEKTSFPEGKAVLEAAPATNLESNDPDATVLEGNNLAGAALVDTVGQSTALTDDVDLDIERLSKKNSTDENRLNIPVEDGKIENDMSDADRATADENLVASSNKGADSTFTESASMESLDQAASVQVMKKVEQDLNATIEESGKMPEFVVIEVLPCTVVTVAMYERELGSETSTKSASEMVSVDLINVKTDASPKRSDKTATVRAKAASIDGDTSPSRDSGSAYSSPNKPRKKLAIPSIFESNSSPTKYSMTPRGKPDCGSKNGKLAIPSIFSAPECKDLDAVPRTPTKEWTKKNEGSSCANANQLSKPSTPVSSCSNLEKRPTVPIPDSPEQLSSTVGDRDMKPNSIGHMFPTLTTNKPLKPTCLRPSKYATKEASSFSIVPASEASRQFDHPKQANPDKKGPEITAEDIERTRREILELQNQIKAGSFEKTRSDWLNGDTQQPADDEDFEEVSYYEEVDATETSNVTIEATEEMYVLSCPSALIRESPSAFIGEIQEVPESLDSKSPSMDISPGQLLVEIEKNSPIMLKGDTTFKETSDDALDRCDNNLAMSASAALDVIHHPADESTDAALTIEADSNISLDSQCLKSSELVASPHAASVASTNDEDVAICKGESNSDIAAQDVASASADSDECMDCAQVTTTKPNEINLDFVVQDVTPTIATTEGSPGSNIDEATDPLKNSSKSAITDENVPEREPKEKAIPPSVLNEGESVEEHAPRKKLVKLRSFFKNVKEKSRRSLMPGARGKSSKEKV